MIIKVGGNRANRTINDLPISPVQASRAISYEVITERPLFTTTVALLRVLAAVRLGVCYALQARLVASDPPGVGDYSVC